MHYVIQNINITIHSAHKQSQIARRCRSAVGPPLITLSARWRHQLAVRRNFVQQSNVGSTSANQAVGPTSAQRRQTKRSVQRRLNFGKPSGRSNGGPTAAQRRPNSDIRVEGPPNIHDHQYIQRTTNTYKEQILFVQMYIHDHQYIQRTDSVCIYMITNTYKEQPIHTKNRFCLYIHDHQYIQRTTNTYKEQILFLKGLLFNKIQYQHDQSESEVNMASLRAAASATTWSFF